MRAGHLAAIACLAGLLGASPAALAVVIAPHPPLSATGHKYGAPARCPEAEVVRIPAYPGSYCTGATGGHRYSKGNPLPFVQLVTRASPKKVARWYRNHLPAWLAEKARVFFPAGLERYQGTVRTPGEAPETIAAKHPVWRMVRPHWDPYRDHHPLHSGRIRSIALLSWGTV